MPLDNDRRGVGMNDCARRVLPVDCMQPFDQRGLTFHPDRSRPKAALLPALVGGLGGLARLVAWHRGRPAIGAVGATRRVGAALRFRSGG